MKKFDPVVLAFFTAFAITVYVLESYIPKPLPFLRLGLANIIILLFVWKNHFLEGLIIMLAKIIMGNILSGMFLSPMLIISLAAGVTAFGAMYLAVKLKIPFSLAGISILAACIHNVTQLIIVKVIIIPQTSVLRLLPLLLIMGMISGLICGYIAYYLQKQSIIRHYLR